VASCFFPSLPVPVVFPIHFCLADVFLLALLHAAGRQNHKPPVKGGEMVLGFQQDAMRGLL
jgi:hypothetical protein